MDREEKLRRLREIKNVLLPELTGEYEGLRDDLIDEVEQDGIVYFLGKDGKKYRAYVERQTRTTYDLGILKEELDAETFDEITDRKINVERFNEAARDKDRVPRHVLQKAMKDKPVTPFVMTKEDAPAPPSDKS